MQIIGKGFDIPSFKKYVDGVALTSWRPQFVVVHNTSSPTQKLYREWHDRAGWTGEQWMQNLKSYYSGLGWAHGPHLFVAYDKIWVFSPLNQRGTHTPSWNSISWGVETVAEFQSEPFNDGVKTNLIAALGILHNHAGLDPANYKLGVRGMHYHKEDKVSSHQSCPGKNLIKKDLVASVVAYMNNGVDTSHHDVPIVSQEFDGFLTDEESSSIAWLQIKLNRQGYAPPLIVDGSVGTKTKTAVKWFQKKSGLNVDGIAGPLTRLALKEADWKISNP